MWLGLENLLLRLPLMLWLVEASVPSWLLAGGPSSMPCVPFYSLGWVSSQYTSCLPGEYVSQRGRQKTRRKLQCGLWLSFGSYTPLLLPHYNCWSWVTRFYERGRRIKLYLFKEDIWKILLTYFKSSTVCLQG